MFKIQEETSLLVSLYRSSRREEKMKRLGVSWERLAVGTRGEVRGERLQLRLKSYSAKATKVGRSQAPDRRASPDSKTCICKRSRCYILRYDEQLVSEDR